MAIGKFEYQESRNIYQMKKIIILIALTGISSFSVAQSCDKKSCGPEGTKTEEARVISSLRADLQAVVNKMSQSGISFEREISQMEITKGANDDESLLFISQAASAIRYELLNKVEPTKITSQLKEYKPGNLSSKQKLVSSLQKEIKILANQADKI
jgi:hypothetical protein